MEDDQTIHSGLHLDKGNSSKVNSSKGDFPKPHTRQDECTKKASLLGNKELAGTAAAILCAVLFGTMPLMAKSAFALGSNAYTTSAARFFCGAILSLLLLLIVPGWSPRVTKKQLLTLAVLSLFYATTPVLLYSSYNRIETGLATTLHFSYPITVMLLSALFLHEKIGKKELLCALLCMTGIVLLYSPGAKTDMLGILIALLSGVTYALYVILIGKSDLKKLPVMTLTFWLSCFSSLEIILVGTLTHNLTLHLPAQVWIPFLGLGLFATVMALALFQVGVFLIGPIKTSLLCTFEPITSLVIGVLFFHEALTPRSLLGILFILVAVLLLVVLTRKEEA